METNEIMKNEEVTEAVTTATDEILKDSSGRFKTAAIGGLTALFGGLAVQYAVIPMIAKIRARKKKQNSDAIVEGEFAEVGDEKSDFEEDMEDK